MASKQPNELGLYDMSGNVWEYSSDWYAELTDLPAEQGTDYAGPATGTLVVNQGGGFKSTANNLPLIHRDWINPQASDNLPTRGFRLVLAAPSDNYSTPQPVAVDLGLPSGTKWANMNVGAEKPEDYGLYFAWGETVGYSSDTSDGHSFNWANYKWCNGAYNTMTKYCTRSDRGTVDNKTVLDLEDDAAYVNWGDKWRMATNAELDELRKQCTWTWQTADNTEFNGVAGYKVTGTNGNSIFLPAAGERYNAKLDEAGRYGLYWSASLDEEFTFRAYFVSFNSEDAGMYGSHRGDGMPVRPVLRN